MATHITKKDLKRLWSQLKQSAQKRNIPFNLTPTDIDQIGIPLTCPILGIPLHFHNNTPQDDSISFDRIDSTKGYTVDNIVVISYKANRIKSNATLDELKKLVQFYENLTPN